ncbi:TPA: hypothetical protein DCX16_03875 [bacterium]|nr:hypothetical protein [bacterium]
MIKYYIKLMGLTKLLDKSKSKGSIRITLEVASILGIFLCGHCKGLTLNEAINIGLKNNRELLCYEKEIEKEKLHLKSLYAEFYPHISLSNSLSYSRSFKDKEKDPYSTAISISLNQPIFKAELFPAIREQRLSLNERYLSYKQKRQELILNIAREYYNIKRLIEIEKELKKSFERLKKLLEIAELKYKEGYILKIDLDEASLSLKMKEMEIVENDKEIEISKEGLKILIGATSPIEISDFSPIELKIYDNSFILENNINIKKIKMSQERLNLSLKKINRELFPSVSLSGSYNWQFNEKNLNKSFDNLEGDGSWAIYIKCDIPIFDGGIRKNRIKEVKLSMYENRIILEEEKDKLILSTKRLKDELENIEERIELKKAQIRLCEERLNINTLKFKEGRSKITDILEDEEDLLRANSSYVSVGYDHEIKKMEYYREIGVLEDFFED